MEKFTPKQVKEFKLSDWVFERSSGYAGYRNININSDLYGEWIFDREHSRLHQSNGVYKRDAELLHNFRRDCLPFGQLSDQTITDFLDKIHFEK